MADIYRGELWKDIKEHEGLYQASNLGRIKALNYYNRGIVKVLKPSAKNGQYLKVCLRKGEKMHYRWVHTLIAETFLPIPDTGKTQVDHIDGNKQNNYCGTEEANYTDGNLRYATPKENTNNPNTRHGGYHLSDEVRARMSAAQKKRMKEHPEDLLKMWEGRRRKNKKSR